MLGVPIPQIPKTVSFRRLLQPSVIFHGMSVVLGVAAVVYGGVTLQQLAAQTEPDTSFPTSNFVTHAPDSTASAVTVDVAGAVKNPGLYQVPIRARVGEVLELAGGLTKEADLLQISQAVNLAHIVNDGQKIYFPFKNSSSVPQTSQASSPTTYAGESQGGSGNQSTKETSNKVSINTATEDELVTLDGIGEKRAADIIGQRPYSSLAELVEKGVLTTSLFEKLKDTIDL